MARSAFNQDNGEMMADTPDISLEDSIEDVSLLEPTETVEESKPDTTESDAEDTTEQSETAEKSEKTDQTEQEQTETEVKLEKEDTQEDRNARARQEYLNRQRIKNQVGNQLDQSYGPKTEQELREEGVENAGVEALRQEMQYAQQRAYISELNAGMQAEAVNAMNDFPMFNENSTEYDKEFADMVGKQYEQAARLQVDPNTNVILNAEIPLYDYYQQMAAIYQRGASKGTTKGQQETLQMISKTDDVGTGNSSARSGNETLEEMEARLGDMPIV